MAFQFLQSLIDGNEQLLDEEGSDIDVNELCSESSDSDDDSDIDGPSTSTKHTGTGMEWSDQLSNVTEKMGAFTEYEGGLHDLPIDSLPLDYFKLFVTDKCIEDFVIQTNLYAEQQLTNQSGSRTSAIKWSPVNADEINKYIYINIMFGLHQVPDGRLYWSSDNMWRVPAVADVMSRDRYDMIHRFFHVNDSSLQPTRDSENYDPLFKVRPFLDHVRHNCLSLYKPQRQLSVDEAMVGFRGRLGFKQYMKDKPTAWGLKIWCCAESKTGYILNFKVYTGKREVSSNNGLGYDVVMAMTEPFLDKRHEIYFDNFFSSPRLAEDLLARDTYCCATIRPNRKGWPMKKSKQKKGEFKMQQKGLLVACQWTDKRQVNMLSTNSNPEMTLVQRRSKDGIIQVEIPCSVDSYNSHMFGVDLGDQHRSYYPVGRPSHKWWRYLFWYLIQISIINGYLLMKQVNPNSPLTQSHLKFRAKLAQQLLALKAVPTSSRACHNRPSVAGIARPFSPQHMLSTMPGRKRRCYQCAMVGAKMPSGRTKETTKGCHLCQVYLHAGQCYSTYHDSLK